MYKGFGEFTGQLNNCHLVHLIDKLYFLEKKKNTQMPVNLCVYWQDSIGIYSKSNTVPNVSVNTDLGWFLIKEAQIVLNISHG